MLYSLLIPHSLELHPRTFHWIYQEEGLWLASLLSTRYSRSAIFLDKSVQMLVLAS